MQKNLNELNLQDGYFKKIAITNVKLNAKESGDKSQQERTKATDKKFKQIKVI